MSLPSYGKRRRTRRIPTTQSQTSLYGFRRHLFGLDPVQRTRRGGDQKEEEEEEEDDFIINLPEPSIATRYHMDGTDGIAAFCSKQPIRPLWEHQCSGARFMEDRFLGKIDPVDVRGGAVLDDMRMGKSGTCIAFLASTLQTLVAQGKPRFGLPSIVVGTKDSAPPWKWEIDAMYGQGFLSVKFVSTEQISSMGNIHEEVIEDDCIYQTDIIITTYGTLTASKSHVADVLRRISYRHIILDEAHKIGNAHTNAFQMIDSMQSESRWLVTGTPIQNNMESLVSMLRLLGKRVDKPKTEQEAEALVEYFSRLSIRRVSPERAEVIDKPIPWIMVDFTSPLERQLYEHFLVSLATAKPNHDSQAGHHALRVLSLLGLFCISPYLCEEKFSNGEVSVPDGIIYLPKEFVNSLLNIPPPKPSRDDDPMESVEFYDNNNDPASYHQQLVLEVAARELFFEAIGNDIPTDAIYGPFTPDDMQWISDNYAVVDSVRQCIIPPVSHKERYVLKNLLSALTDKSGEKIIIFSDRCEALDRFAYLLQRRLDVGVPNAREFVYIHGNCTPRNRIKARQRFSTDPRCGVLLATKKVNSEGVDLSCANHVVFIDPWWNPNVEHQGNQRVGGSNQTHQVHTYRLLTPRTIDVAIAGKSDEKLTYNKLLPVKVTERQMAQSILQKAMKQSFHH